MPLLLHSTEYEKAVIGQQKKNSLRKESVDNTTFREQTILEKFPSHLQNLQFKQRKKIINISLHECILMVKLT